MKIIKIYSNKNFKNLEFNEGLNSVIAFIKSNKKEDTHNLGKTSLIRVIDFLLLAKINKSTDKLFGNNIFIGQVFYGEFLLNSGKYLIIKRSVNSPTKVSFKINDNKSKDYILDWDWDEEDMTFDKAKEKLNDYLSFDILENWPYRKSITYFLRSQQDWLDVFKLNKFKGKHKDWKPFVFDLLGFNGELIKEKLEFEEETDDLKKKLSIIKSEAQIDTDEQDKLNGLLEIKESEIKEIENFINKFNFYQSDIQVNKRIVEEIDNRLQILNTERYRITYEIERTRKSLSDIFDDIEINNIKRLFNEVELYFPEQLEKKYEDLINFQKTLSFERKTFLQENLSELELELNTINPEIKELEDKKSILLSTLTEKDSYQKFKHYQKSLTKTEVEIERIKDKLKAIDNSLLIENDIEKNKGLVEDKVEEIKQALKERKHSEINKIFNSIIKTILDTNALLSLNVNKQGNVDFSADYQNKTNLLETSESQGTTYMKLLCVSFDLAILIKYSNKSFYKFAYHDGVLEGLDDRIKECYIEMVKDVCSQYNLQYILTLIDSDLPKTNTEIISDDEICLKLHDNDNDGKLFLNSF